MNICILFELLLYLIFCQPQPPVKDCVLWMSLAGFGFGIGKVKDVAQGSGVSTVELDFRLVSVATRFVEVSVDEALHGVDVEEEFCDLVGRV